jgi:hypothetical protein
MLKFIAPIAVIMTISTPAIAAPGRAAMEKVWPVYLGKDGYGQSIRLLSNEGAACGSQFEKEISRKCWEYGATMYLSGTGDARKSHRQALFDCANGNLVATYATEEEKITRIDAYPKSAPFQAMAIIACAAVADNR